jgi:hypothetical protein
MKFRLIEDYTDYSYISNGVELVSDASDEQPDDEKEIEVVNKPLYKKFIVTIQNKPQCEINAIDRKEAALKCREKFGRDIKILGIKEK